MAVVANNSCSVPGALLNLYHTLRWDTFSPLRAILYNVLVQWIHLWISHAPFFPLLVTSDLSSTVFTIKKPTPILLLFPEAHASFGFTCFYLTPFHLRLWWGCHIPSLSCPFRTFGGFSAFYRRASMAHMGSNNSSQPPSSVGGNAGLKPKSSENRHLDSLCSKLFLP